MVNRVVRELEVRKSRITELKIGELGVRDAGRHSVFLGSEKL